MINDGVGGSTVTPSHLRVIELYQLQFFLFASLPTKTFLGVSFFFPTPMIQPCAPEPRSKQQ